jgi:hypothetical protein
MIDLTYLIVSDELHVRCLDHGFPTNADSAFVRLWFEGDEHTVLLHAHHHSEFVEVFGEPFLITQFESGLDFDRGILGQLLLRPGSQDAMLAAEHALMIQYHFRHHA